MASVTDDDDDTSLHVLMMARKIKQATDRKAMRKRAERLEKYGFKHGVIYRGRTRNHDVPLSVVIDGEILVREWETVQGSYSAMPWKTTVTYQAPNFERDQWKPLQFKQILTPGGIHARKQFALSGCTWKKYSRRKGPLILLNAIVTPGTQKISTMHHCD